jgi:hypothetical protein
MIADLIAQAKKAKPEPEQRERQDYSEIYPAYVELRRRDFGPMAAVDWLIEKGALSPEHRGHAYRAFGNRWFRREGK